MWAVWRVILIMLIRMRKNPRTINKKNTHGTSSLELIKIFRFRVTFERSDVKRVKSFCSSCQMNTTGGLSTIFLFSLCLLVWVEWQTWRRSTTNRLKVALCDNLQEYTCTSINHVFIRRVWADCNATWDEGNLPDLIVIRSSCLMRPDFFMHPLQPQSLTSAQ